MIVEFVGCSGSGKTTQLYDVIESLSREDVRACCSDDVVAARTHTAWIVSPSRRNLPLNFVLLPWLLGMLKQHAAFYGWILGQISRHSHSPLKLIQQSLSVSRKFASYRLLRGIRDVDVVLVDEGTICGFQNMVSCLDILPDREMCARYLGFAPQPDLVVHMNTPLDTALERTRRRPDPPRMFGGGDRMRYISLSHAAFLRLSACVEDDGWWFTVNPTVDDATADISRQIVSAILARMSPSTCDLGKGF